MPPVAASIAWRILAITATPIARPAVDLRHYLALARGTPAGHSVDWDDLYVLARNTLQVTNALIVAPHPERRAPLASDDDLDLLAASEVVIACSRAAAWTLWIPGDWLAAVSRAFRDVRAVIPGEQPLTI